MKKTFLIFLSFYLVCGIILNAQDRPQRWVDVPQNLWMYNPAVIVNSTLPVGNENYINTFNKVRYLNSPSGINLINPNIRVLPRTNSWQSEVIMVRHPLNPLIMFGSSNAFSNLGSLWISEGVYMTTDGGITWYGSDTLNGAPNTNHGGDPGPTIDKNGNIIMTHLGYTTGGMYGNYSTDNGLTWSSNFTIQSGSVDKNLAGTDDAPSSPFYGRSYCVYTSFSSPYPARISYTTNGGVSWSAPANILTPVSGMIARGEDVRVGPNGEVYTCWSNTVGNGPETQCSFAKSTDGGVTFTGTNNAFAMNGLLIFGGGYGSYNIRMNSFPRIDVDRSGGPRNGWIYIVTSQRNLTPAIDDDIVLHRSTDGGATWSAGIRVNQDTPGNGKLQFYNAVRVDEYGAVNVVYYDNRNTSADSAEVMVSRSLNGGDTWTDIVVSHRFKPKPVTLSGIAGGYAGDYIGITSGNNKVWPIWMDDITGIYQAWTTSIDLGPAINHTPLGNTEQTTGTRAINCVITPAGSPIVTSLTKLFVAKNAGAYDSVQMTNSSGTNWTGNITLNGSGTYKYYLRTVDNLNRIAFAPAGAPGNFYSFQAMTDTVKPVITHTQIGPTPKSYWPVTFTASVTDNIGVDSVWVEWYKNTPTIIKEFKLLPQGSNNYSAAFNSINADVNVGDVIYYKVKADDISSIHNVASLPLTGYYSFGIVNLKLCEGFNNTTFPPTNWSLTGSAITYWSYDAVSGYGLGTGSARFNFYSATAGMTAQLVTLQFDPSPAGDSIKLVLAHAYYSATYIDTLRIESSTDNGTTWSDIWTLWSQTNFTDPHSLSTVSQTGIFVPTASQWKSMAYLLPTGTNKLRFNAVSGYGNDMFIDSICQRSSIVTSIGNNQNTIPLLYNLSQNYPNPFNPATQIKYDLPKQGFVTLKIYDVLGREITKLVNEVKSPGSYIVDFDGTNLSSGVYFYKLEVNGFNEVKRMMLIK
jgi:hypothetical protein